ncbi:hypothetical protein CU669_19030 [Paramagnetospirillum kuznetsovii]|uniref:Uncharacterized protein n=1 Tax=Paramagnetospirillum kuznetsovii TaxID=2053833 RepID=A0A364NTK1_9PROT|nr:hypothetical protein [Paramagnetospirillum kuznetsovii]RAU20340.1 hypothetical protein CU669_19030 [Paramagnetospirillum kuznetsovii]
MSGFNRMTVVAAAEVVAEFNSHSDMGLLEVQWGVSGRCDPSSKSARTADLSRVAIDENPEVMMENGRMSLSRAIIETAIQAPPKTYRHNVWTKLKAGLRFDGYEVHGMKDGSSNGWAAPDASAATKPHLVRMLPDGIPGLDFREAESEVLSLLDRHAIHIAKGHLRQALSAFERGEWSSANGELRNFFESYLNEISELLGCMASGDSKAKRDFLGNLQPPFLLTEYNEWNANNQKPQYVQGLMSRMHPHGGHPGLSEEEDATFRLQITLITARLFLRRFDIRKNS